LEEVLNNWRSFNTEQFDVDCDGMRDYFEVATRILDEVSKVRILDPGIRAPLFTL
jgi:hypothetical protein